MKVELEIGTNELKIIRPALRRYFNEKAHISIEELIMMAVRHIANEEGDNYQDWKTAAIARLHCNVVANRRSN